MISLVQPQSSFTMELPHGVSVTVRPLTTASMAMSRAKALHRAEKSYPDSDDQVERNGMYRSELVMVLAEDHLIAWDGVADESGVKDASLNTDNIRKLMGLHPMGERFYEQLTLQQALLNAAGNGCGPTADGISRPVEGQDIAESATQKDSHAAGGNQG